MNPAAKLEGIHLRISPQELGKILKAAGKMHEFGYVRDDHFERYVLNLLVTTYDQAKAVMAMLNADRYAMEGKKEWGCQKVRAIQHWYKQKLWRRNYPAAPLAHARRVHCSCHKVDSFALSEVYFRNIAEQQKNKRNG